MSASLDRWIIKGFFKTLSPLSIGTGLEEGLSKEGKPTIQGIELDCDNNPFIPGTAVKGMLRALAATTIDDGSRFECAAKRLLGNLPNSNAQAPAEISRGGILTCRNAWIADQDKQTEPAIRGRTAIHRGTRTALDAHLRHDRAVPEGTTFEVEFVLDKASEEEALLLVALLRMIDGSGVHSALGSGTGQGDGLVVWQEPAETIKRFGAAQMAEWLKADKPWKECTESFPDKDEDLSAIGGPVTPGFAHTLKIHIDGHFLVSQQNPDKGSGEADKDKPDLVPLGAGAHNTPILPGSSLDGALSSQAERIWRTMAGDVTDWAAPKRQPDCHELLFGSTASAGLLNVGNFAGQSKEPVRLDFVAIDRFTGGSLDGAKFAVKAFEAPTLEGKIALTFKRAVNHKLTGKPAPNDDEPHTKALSAAAVGLLALTLKDLAQGDIPLGYGTRKGLGRVGNLTDGNGGDWRAILAALGDAARGPDGPLPDAQSGEDAIREAVRALEAEAKAQAHRDAHAIPVGEAAE